MRQDSKGACMQLRSLSPRLTLCLAGACLGLVSCSSPQPGQFASGGVRDNLAAHVQFLAQPKLEGRKTGTAGARLARQYIEARFRACGLVPWPQEKSYELSYGLGKNLVGILPGSDTNLSGEIVLVSAHYDHEGKDKQGRIYAGAVDNASGVAALIELGRLLKDSKPGRTIRFVAFANEERPLLRTAKMGSRVYAHHCRERGEQIIAMLSVETIGYCSENRGSQWLSFFGLLYPSRGNFIVLVANIASRRLLGLCGDSFRRQLRWFDRTGKNIGALGEPELLLAHVHELVDEERGELVGRAGDDRARRLRLGVERAAEDVEEAHPAVDLHRHLAGRLDGRVGGVGAGVLPPERLTLGRALPVVRDHLDEDRVDDLALGLQHLCGGRLLRRVHRFALPRERGRLEGLDEARAEAAPLGLGRRRRRLR